MGEGGDSIIEIWRWRIFRFFLLWRNLVFFFFFWRISFLFGKIVFIQIID